MLRDTDDMNEPQHTTAEDAADVERAERVARVMEAVRSGTYQVRSDVTASRLLESMLRRPLKR